MTYSAGQKAKDTILVDQSHVITKINIKDGSRWN